MIYCVEFCSLLTLNGLEQTAKHLSQLKLSHEHQGFAFEKYPDVAQTLLQHHSGGKCSLALKMATEAQGKGR